MVSSPPWIAALLVAAGLVFVCLLLCRSGGGKSPVFEEVFFVNLKKRTGKRRKMEAQLQQCGKELATTISRFNAVDGARLNHERCGGDVLTPAGKDAITLWFEPPSSASQRPESSKAFGLSLTPGALGCALSHKAIWEKVAREKLGRVLVLEDDAVLPEGFVRAARETLSQLPANWDFVYLGSGQYEFEEAITSCVVRPTRAYGLFAYAVTWTGCEKLLQGCFPLRYQLDTELWMNFSHLRVFLVHPPLVDEQKTKSDIQI